MRVVRAFTGSSFTWPVLSAAHVLVIGQEWQGGERGVH